MHFIWDHVGPEPWLKPFIPQHGRVFIDIGAHAGPWTRWLAPFYKSIHSIEPNSELLSNVPDNVIVHPIAAWSSKTKVKFTITYDSMGNQYNACGTSYHPLEDGQVVLDCIDIDSMEALDVDLIKIDVEGSEYQVVLGALKTITIYRPFLVIEIHNKSNYEEIYKLLSSMYSIQNIHEPEQLEDDPLYNDYFWMICKSK